MKNRILLPMCVAVAFLLVACAKEETTTNRNAAPSTGTSTSTPATTTAAGGDKIGIPECDDFLAAYDACVSSKVPEVARAQYKETIEQWRSSWKKLSGNPETRNSLAAACRQSAEQARVQMKSFDCTF